ncbi:MAG: hypothetical protein WD205_07525 [Rhodothermales bacterium]
MPTNLIHKPVVAKPKLFILLLTIVQILDTRRQDGCILPDDM